MTVNDILLFLIINFFHLFLGYGFFTIFLKHNHSKRFLFLFSWAALWAVINILYYYLITSNNQIQIFLAVIIGSILLVSAIIFNLYDKIQEDISEKIKNVLYQQQIEYYTRQYQEISHNQQETRKMRHELKNNYILLEALAKEGDTNGILNCLHDMYKPISTTAASHTGNMVVDAVLNSKIETAQRHHIHFDLSLNIPTRLDTNEVRLCGLLGNALDNAIEACLHIPEKERYIKVLMKVEKKNLFIEIENPYDGTIYSDSKGQLITRKKNRMNHGFGLTIMNELLSDNSGSLEPVWDNKVFYLRIILYLVI